MITDYASFLKLIKSFDKKPKLLLHACCAPCSSHCLMLLNQYFDITIFFSNDNIYPKSEFDFRLDELKRFLDDANLSNVGVISAEYDESRYDNAVKGYEHLGEKSLRCYKCYTLRMEETAKLCKKLGYDYFTTTLSISPHKLEKWINEIGYSLEEKYGVKYLYSNFKKENGYKNSIELSKKYNLYRQDYCGCKYSLEERKNNDRCNKEN